MPHRSRTRSSSSASRRAVSSTAAASPTPEQEALRQKLLAMILRNEAARKSARK
jgi:hypothetical protein